MVHAKDQLSMQSMCHHVCMHLTAWHTDAADIVLTPFAVLQYRTVAARGAMLFFLLNSLNKIHAFYQYSLNAFVTVFSRAIDVAPGNQTIGLTCPALLSMLNRLRYHLKALFTQPL